jgi:hypothetical protein
VSLPQDLGYPRRGNAKPWLVIGVAEKEETFIILEELLPRVPVTLLYLTIMPNLTQANILVVVGHEREAEVFPHANMNIRRTVRSSPIFLSGF